ncbi:uncharacterized protein LOC123564901 isoform X4 [Mercenaria mercenaria]|uniref:uncharacterized protein LOC123564901 isoform X4 n=1 Tax=Mercenaria mercenaria TaxID=6596 RepID=UPI00234EF536|nr:uncharacterized protein LOC123564901 isoform X4 [Mercenaria mercenaria]
MDCITFVTLIYQASLIYYSVFPLSPELRSGKCYACGVDVCEEGIQFCNTHERRCEYCTDHHQDCFTYAQQQNCTQYCQDQWRKTLLDNCTVCEAIECEDALVYKIMSSVLSVLLLVIVFVLILQVKQIRRILKSVILFFIPDQVEKLFKRNVTARQNAQPQNRRATDYEELAIQDTKTETIHDNNDKRDKITEEIEIQKLTKAKPTVNHNTDRKTFTGTYASKDALKQTEESESHDSLSFRQKPGTSNINPSRKTVGTGFESDKQLPDIVNGPRIASTIAKTSENNVDKIQSADEFQNENEEKTLKRQEETELLKQYNKSPETYDSEDLFGVSQPKQHLSVSPHGELSTMSSRGGYQEMLHSSNQSTDKGYATTVPYKIT